MVNRIYSETLHALEHAGDPAGLLHELHEFVLNRIAQDGFYFPMAAARFSLDGRRMSFATAGHPPALHVSNGAVRRLDSRTGILGLLPEVAPFAAPEEMELAPGGRVIFYTDGLVDVFNTLGECSGLAAWKHWFARALIGPFRNSSRRS